MFDHRIENRQQLSHACDQGNFRCFACLFQPGVKNFDDGISSTGNQRSHVEHCPYACPAAPNSTMASQGAAVAIERRNTDQSSNLFTVEFSEFWQLSEKSAADDRTDAGDTPEKIFVLTPDRTLTDGLVEIFVGSVQLRFQPADVSIDSLCDTSRGSTEPVSLGHHHLGDLAPAGNQSS